MAQNDVDEDQSIAAHRGARGPEGRQGTPGREGRQGEQGDRGPKGEPGEPGPVTQGLPGLKGDKGERGDPGGKGDRGERGDRGLTGEKGDRGETGDRGDRGPVAPTATTLVATADDYVCETVVPGPIPGLTLDVKAGIAYWFRYLLAVDTDAPLPLFDIAAPSSRTCRWSLDVGPLTVIEGIVLPTADGTLDVIVSRQGTGTVTVGAGSIGALTAAL